MKFIRKFIYFAVIFSIVAAISSHANTRANSTPLSDNSTLFYFNKLLNNISPNDGLPGSVIAATSRDNPNYYYHWVRDAALTMDALIQIYPDITTDKQQPIKSTLFDYLKFSATIQQAQTLSGLGEPKFYLNGTAYNQPWGRPQNDAPALRAISLIHFANLLLKEGNISLVKSMLYDSRYPSSSPVKLDLEYISHHWKEPCYDLWEEVKGTHFYTLMVERRAMLEGATLADKLGDKGAATWYRSQGREIEIELSNFWDEKQQHFNATINQIDGLEGKTSNLDTAVILGLLHGDMNDGFLSWDNPKVLATLSHLVDTFQQLYPINQNTNIPGTAIGRYPEDRYGGSHFNGGNPWPLCTLAVAEAYYRYAKILKLKGEDKNANNVITYANKFIERVHYHAHEDGSLNEQIDKNTGYMTSVSNLTWNYAAILTTTNSRNKL